MRLKSQGNCLRAIRNKLSDFSDADKIASWAYEAMKLLVETGMISGSGGARPDCHYDRAEMAQCCITY